jgi:ABC-2 type transport system ATP-binding protein
MIITEGLSKHFGAIKAIDDFTIEIPDGKIFGLLGPNGAGKTTTMRILACLIKPTSGKAFIDEYEIGKENDNQNIRAQIGLLPEVPGLYETLSAYKNLDYYAQLYDVPKAKREENIKNLLTSLDLWKRKDDSIGEFSKGMKQKIAIARALVHEPKYLFLDEPTAALDPEASKMIRNYILELKSKGRTILINTHNLAEAERICDTIAVVKNRLIKVGNPKELAHKLFARTISITLDFIPDSLINDFTTLDYVTNIRTQGNKLFLNVKAPEENNPKIVSWLTKRGLNIQFISEEEYSLEDVYLKLIEEAQ